MNDLVELLARGALMGVAGAASMDAWSLLLRRRFGIATLDYALLGRWIGHLPRGRFVHPRIAAASPIPGERPLGWLAHYAIGIAFAVPVVLVGGAAWTHSPTIWLPLLVGLGTIVAPWFVMQPAMGAGVAGARTPNPTATRLRNLASHTVYGIGLWLAAMLLAVVAGA